MHVCMCTKMQQTFIGASRQIGYYLPYVGGWVPNMDCWTLFLSQFWSKEYCIQFAITTTQKLDLFQSSKCVKHVITTISDNISLFNNLSYSIM